MAQPSSARSLESLNLPLSRVVASDALCAQVRNGKGGETVVFDGGKISARYEPEYRLIRTHIRPNFDVVNIKLSEDGQIVKGISGYPEISAGKLQGLVRVGLLKPDMLTMDADRSAADAPQPLAFSTPMAIESEIAAPSLSRPISGANYGQFLTNEDIIHPRELAKLERNKDYVLLVHSPRKEAVDAIKLHGLRSLKDVANDDDASQDVKGRFKNHDSSSHFGNDPNLIYFRPVGKRYPVRDGDVAIAVKLESAKVYDQEHRDRGDGSAGTYRASEIPISQYLDMESKQPAGTYLDRYKRIVPYSQYKSGSDYLPEVCVKADRISPEFFVGQDGAL